MAWRNDRVSDVIRVLRQMRSLYNRQQGHSDVAELRKSAVATVAESDSRRSAFKTIFDACRRRLEPDINGVEQFDALAEKWLRNGSMRLKEILLKHSNDPVRRTQVIEFFSENSERAADAQHTSARVQSKEIATTAGPPIQSPNPDEVRVADESDIEGLKTEHRVVKTKRSRKLRNAAFDAAKGVCCVCDRNFSELLRGRGVRVLQVHHRNQLASRESSSVTRQSDLAVVCANCHLLIHLDPKKALTVEELRKMLRADGFYD